MQETDYYAVLGIGSRADTATIKQAYKKQAIRFHPDRNPDDAGAEAKMARLNEAYGVLSNPEKRQDYDHLRQRFGNAATGRFRQNYSHEQILRESDIERIFQEIADNFGIRGFNELFSSGKGRGSGFFMFGTFGGGRRQASPGRGSLLQGVGKTLLKNILSQAIAAPDGGQDIFDTIALSPSHARAGGPYAYYHREKDKKLVVTVPANVSAGRKIRLKGMGRLDPVTGHTGDLYLTITLKTSLLSKLKKRLIR